MSSRNSLPVSLYQRGGTRSNTPAVTRSPVIPRETQDHLSLQNSHHRPPIFHRDHSPAGSEQGGAGDAGKEGLVGAGAGVEVVASTALRGHHVVAFPRQHPEERWRLLA